MACSLSGSSVHGIFQARVQEWVAISFSRGYSRPRNRTQVSHIADRCFTVWATREAHYLPYLHVIPLKVYSLWMKADRNKKIMESNKNLILEGVVLFKKITSKEKFVDKIWSIKRETIHVLLHANVLSWLAEKSWRIQKEVNRRVFHLGLKFGRIQDPVNIGKTV